MEEGSRCCLLAWLSCVSLVGLALLSSRFRASDHSRVAPVAGELAAFLERPSRTLLSQRTAERTCVSS